MAVRKIKKITEEDIRKEVRKLKKLSAEDKDVVVAMLFVAVERISELLKDVVREESNVKKLTSEVKEIEDILSLGPQWFNYTRKVKRKKN